MKSKILLFVLLLVASAGFSQSGAVKFYANAEPSEIQLGESFTLSFTLSNTTGSDFIPPDLHNFTVISGPNRSVSVQSINGNWKQITEYSFTLMPKKAGTFTIGPATIIVKKGTLESNSLTIKVNESSKISAGQHNGTLRKADGKKDFFVEVVPEKSLAFTGEQVAVDFIFYTRVSVQDFRIVEAPGFGGAYAQELKFYDVPQSQVDINGTTFIKKLIKRFVVFPQESGKIDIQPMTLEVNVFTDSGDPFSGFFGRETETKYFTTENTSIKVEQIPGNAPANFLGAVGNWQINLSPVNTHISKNDALSLLLTVEGDGDIKNVQMPEIQLSKDFEIFSPKTVEENSTEKNGKIISKKVFELLLTPKAEGNFELSSDFSWFDTSKKQFESKKFGPFSIVVEKAKPRDEAADDEQQHDGFSSLVPALKKYLAIGAGIVILAALIWSVFFIRSKRKNSKLIKTEQKVQTIAVPAVKPNIIDPAKGLQVYINNADQQQFYNLLRKNLSTFLIQKLNIGNQTASTSEIINRLHDTNQDVSLISTVKTIFSSCEQVLYAGADKSGMMQMMLGYLEDIKSGVKS